MPYDVPPPTPVPVLSVLRPEPAFVQPRLRANRRRVVRIRIACVVEIDGLLPPVRCTGSVRLYGPLRGRGAGFGRTGFDVPTAGGIARLRLTRKVFHRLHHHAIPTLVRITVTNADAPARSAIALSKLRRMTPV